MNRDLQALSHYIETATAADVQIYLQQLLAHRPELKPLLVQQLVGLAKN